jgi:cyclopropane fatty-acyl-phospholipid synthase-like methyltransferase
MEDLSLIAVDAFNEHAFSFESKFMNFSNYDTAIESFCTMIPGHAPKILEIGCGPGNVTKRIKKHIPDAQITALDLADTMLSIAKNNVPDVTFIKMDARAINTITTTFDALVASFVTPFFTYDECRAFFKHCSDRLETDGFLYISTMEGRREQCGFEKTSFSGTTEIPFTYYSLPFLVTELEQSGLSVIYSKKQPYMQNGTCVLTDIIIFCQKKNILT